MPSRHPFVKVVTQRGENLPSNDNSRAMRDDVNQNIRPA
jgi:hypothetical protein